ncbi:hypothetical protein TNCV_139331 [Trichonephila clavipes]|uniref:Uncharacterized protein n=1 Tax=Trichonephila clavipes TaxID=2585209 RepID=A0A8X6RI53_TRICX|nr:hypothetical protein TNCV_139331 [Trichonephila clavipes]
MIEIARDFGNWSRLEMRAIIQFLRAKKVSASPMSRQYMNEHTKMCYSFSIRQMGCRKLQYDKEWPAKYLNDRNHHGTNSRNDLK